MDTKNQKTDVENTKTTSESNNNTESNSTTRQDNQSNVLDGSEEVSDDEIIAAAEEEENVVPLNNNTENENSEPQKPESKEPEDNIESNTDSPIVEEEPQKTSIDELEIIYPVIAHEFQSRFKNNPDDAIKLAKFLLSIVNGRGDKAEKWKDYIKTKCNNGTSKSIIQNKIIPTLVNAFNKKNKVKIELGRQFINGNIIVNPDKLKFVIPDGFNKDLTEIIDDAISNDLGYPVINFKSDLIQQILHETNKQKLKKLLIALTKRIQGTPAEKSMMHYGFFGAKTARSTLYKIIKETASASGIPMVRCPLKAESNDLAKQSDSSNVSVTPINTMAAKNESVDDTDYCPLFEGWFSENVLGRGSSKSAQMFNKPVEIPKDYLQQFYTVIPPTTPQGIKYYTKYMSETDRLKMYDSLDDKSEDIMSSTKNLNEIILAKYLETTSGVPLYYILAPRSNPKERLRICSDTSVNGNTCIKSINGASKVAYFMPSDLVHSIFMAG